MNAKQKLVKFGDDIAKEIAFKRYGKKCEVCGGNDRLTAHHFYYKSSVAHLRYVIENLVILCCHCHALLHFKDPKVIECHITDKRGIKWANRLKKQALNKPSAGFLTMGWIKNEINKLENNV